MGPEAHGHVRQDRADDHEQVTWTQTSEPRRRKDGGPKLNAIDTLTTMLAVIIALCFTAQVASGTVILARMAIGL